MELLFSCYNVRKRPGSWTFSNAIICIIFYLVVFHLRTVHCQPPCEPCRCHDVNNRLTVDCSGVGLSSVPPKLLLNAMVVKLDGNGKFGNSDLIKNGTLTEKYASARDWAELHLRSCDIRKFNFKLFFNMNNLVNLYLSNNKIDEIQITDRLTSPFAGLANLQTLDLSHNEIQLLQNGSFRVSTLLALDLSHNQIRLIEDGAFAEAHKLERIYLAGNRLTTLSSDPFLKLHNMRILSIEDNPFVCDCHLRNLVQWRIKRPIYAPPRCDSPPKYKGKTWDHLSLKEFACAPVFTILQNKMINVNIGSTIKLQCDAKGDPPPDIVWEFHNSSTASTLKSNEKKYKIQHRSQGSSNISTLEILQADTSDLGVYNCRATNFADTKYLIFMLSLDEKSGQIVQKMGEHPSGGVRVLGNKNASNGSDMVMIGLIVGATIFVILALSLAVFCFRKAMKQRDGRTPAIISNQPAVYKAVNGYGYRIIDNGGVGATSPASLVGHAGNGNPALHSPVGPNPVEKPPRTHAENFYAEAPTVCEFHKQQNQQQRSQNADRNPYATTSRARLLDDSRTGLIASGDEAADDSGFSDPDYYYSRQNAGQTHFATMPCSRQQPQQPRILRPAFDDPLLEKKLLLTRRNSDGAPGGNGCVGHCHLSAAEDGRHTMTHCLDPGVYDKAELRETAL